MIAQIELSYPCFLTVIGDADRVEICRSPIVWEDDDWLTPVHEFIEHHGLVLAAQDTFPDTDWMRGEVEMSVYVSPSIRNDVLAGTAMSLPFGPLVPLVG